MEKKTKMPFGIIQLQKMQLKKLVEKWLFGKA